MFFFVFSFIWIRWTVPRFRYDQLMALEGAYWRLYQAQQRQAETEVDVFGRSTEDAVPVSVPVAVPVNPEVKA